MYESLKVEMWTKIGGKASVPWQFAKQMYWRHWPMAHGPKMAVDPSYKICFEFSNSDVSRGTAFSLFYFKLLTIDLMDRSLD
ncbi:hypothetical protein E4U52_007361 [Claviceps spartinae]|nr:hypothetical protein E4U52_007361 [Claviceps spartinae]